MNTEQMLDQYADFESQIDYLKIKKEEIINGVLTEEQRREIKDIEIEFSAKLEAVHENLNNLKELIQKDILENQKSVKGTYKHAIFTQGRTSWDGKKLEGLALEHPAIEKCKKVGSPSVRFLDVK